MTTRRILDHMMINCSDPRDVVVYWEDDNTTFPCITEEMIRVTNELKHKQAHIVTVNLNGTKCWASWADLLKAFEWEDNLKRGIRQ